VIQTAWNTSLYGKKKAEAGGNGEYSTFYHIINNSSTAFVLVRGKRFSYLTHKGGNSLSLIQEKRDIFIFKIKAGPSGKERYRIDTLLA